MTPYPFFPDSYCPLYAYALPYYHAVYNYYVAPPPPPTVGCPPGGPPVPAPEPPCPTIRSAPPTLVPFGKSDTLPSFEVRVEETGCCEFLVTPSANFPCPPVLPLRFGHGPVVRHQGYYSYLYYKFVRHPRPLRYPYYHGYGYSYGGHHGAGDNCEHELYAYLALRCDQAKAKQPQPRTLPFTSGPSKLTLSVVQKANCDIELDLDGVDHCPQFTTDVEITSLAPGATPTGAVSVVDVGGCDFLFTLTLGIPRGCEPSFGFGDMTIEMLDADATPFISGSVDKVGECGFLLNLDLGIPEGGGSGGGAGGGSGSGYCQVRTDDLFRCNPDTGEFEVVPGCLSVRNGRLVFTPDPVT